MTLMGRISTRYGWGLLLPVTVLVAAGVLSIQATSMADAQHGITTDAIKQLVFAAVGVGAMLVAILFGYQGIGRFSYALFFICLGLLGLLVLDRWVDLPMIPQPRNVRRWIDFGPIRLQPSELMKIVFVLALAWYLRYRRNYRTLGGLVMPFLLTLLPMILIKMQPDLGTVLLFLPVLFAMLFAAGAKIKHLSLVVLLGLLALPLFWLKIADYQRLRITGVLLQSPAIRAYLQEPPRWLEGCPTRWDYLRPTSVSPADWASQLDDWESDAGYQLVRSKMAIGAGGMVGQGFGQGLFIEYDFLPERHNDFIFAMIGHQWGLLGSVIVILCYLLIVVIGFDIATMTDDPYGRLVAVGLSTILGVQTLTNLAMTVGLGPITGVTLPFVSAGGSSLVASFICIGLLISVAKHRPIMIARKPFVFNEEAERYRPN